MKKTIALTLVSALPFLSVTAQADLTTLNVNFTPDSDVFYQGEAINVSLSSDGANVQYRYVLDSILDEGFVRITHSPWSSTPQFSLDTQALNLLEGDYRLRVISREQENKPEILVKHHTFSITGPNTAGCDTFQEGTYNNVGAQPLSLNLSLSQATSGLSLTADEHAINIAQLVFSAGSVDVYPVSPMTYTINMLGSGQFIFSTPLSGTYSCIDNTVSINASGTGSTTGVLSGTTVEVSVTFEGDVSINGSNGNLENGAAQFE